MLCKRKAINVSWIKFKAGFDKCYQETGREVVTSVEYCRPPGTWTGQDTCSTWVAGVANLWRTTRDVFNTWESVMSNIHLNNLMASVAKPGVADNLIAR